MLSRSLPSRPPNRRVILALALLLALPAACGRRSPEDRGGGAARDSAAADSAARVHAAAPPPRFVAVPVLGAARLRALVDSLGADRWRLALKLNRLDIAHVRDRDTLVLPLRFADSLDLSPYPRVWPDITDSAKVVFVSLRLQAFAAYEHGRLVRWGPTSTGRADKPTPPGLYHANWKDRDRISTVDEAWRLEWCVNIENREGISLHEYALPGHPASHSCVRLLADDAIWLYEWIDTWQLTPRGQLAATGTPVLVFGQWDWESLAPWKRLPEQPGAAGLSSAELAKAAAALRSGEPPRFSGSP